MSSWTSWTSRNKGQLFERKFSLEMIFYFYSSVFFFVYTALNAENKPLSTHYAVSFLIIESVPGLAQNSTAPLCSVS